MADALRAVLDDDFTLVSPLVGARIGGPASGPKALAFAQGVTPVLAPAAIKSLYATADGSGVVPLISIPSTMGDIVQSEHFDVDLSTGKLTRLRSHYSPRTPPPPAR